MVYQTSSEIVVVKSLYLLSIYAPKESKKKKPRANRMLLNEKEAK